MRKHLIYLGMAALIALSACGNQAADRGSATAGGTNQSQMADMGMDNMNHDGSGDLPAGLKEASSPKFKVGSQAVIHADHMPGMNGALATIVGAYDTVVYSVSYLPADGGPKVSDHKWVIQEELKDPGSAPLSPGTTVTLEADHMAGMNGAEATIDTAEQTTVYMVDYTPTTGGETVHNHKWVVESELSAN